MAEGREILLDYLKSGKKLFDFPGIIKVESLDSIRDGCNVGLIRDSDFYIMENIRITPIGSAGNLIIVQPSPEVAYKLIYDIPQGKLDLKQTQWNTNLGGISSNQLLDFFYFE